MPGIEGRAAGTRVRPGRSRRWPRRLLNAWLVFHLAAIVLAPLSVAPASGLVGEAWRVARPYLQLLYLNHGYHYFAPEPGPSTLLAYTLEFRDDDGRVRSEQGVIPNRGIHPRLLYHRHFMLTERLASEEEWHSSYARHLCLTSGAEAVSVSQMTRSLPTMEEVRNGSTLTDPERYSETPLGSFRCDEF